MASVKEKGKNLRLLKEGKTHIGAWAEGLSQVGWEVESFDLKKDETKLHAATGSLPFVTVVVTNSPRGSKLGHYLREIKSSASPIESVLVVTSDREDTLQRVTTYIAELRESGRADFISLPNIENPDKGKFVEASKRLKLLLDTRAKTVKNSSSASQRKFQATSLDLNNDSSQKLDAGKIAAFWGISNRAFAEEILDKNPQTVHKTPDADALQDALAPLAYIASCLVSLGATEKTARIWLNAPNAAMRGQTPLHWMKQGRSAEVSAIVHDALAGQPG